LMNKTFLKVLPSMKIKLISQFLVLAAASASAVILDGMAAAVDEEIILESDVSEEMINMARELNQQLPTDPKQLKALHDQTLQMLIDRKVMLVKADEEKIVITDEDVNNELVDMMVKMEQQYGGKEEMEKFLASQGATYKAIENNLRRRLKEKEKIQALLNKTIGAKIRITEDQIHEFYDKNRDQLELPEMISLSEVVIDKNPSTQTEQAVLVNMQNIMQMAQRGASFEDLVRRFSEADDAQTGGLVELARGNVGDEDFERAVFALKNAEISSPLRTPRGFELVKMLDLKNDTAKIRHILLLVKPSVADIAAARVKAQQAYDRIKSGEDFAKVAAEYSDDPDAKVTGGKVEEIELAKLEMALPALGTVLKNMSVGDLSQVIDDPKAFFVIRLDRRAQGRELTLDEARSYIQNYLRNIEIEKESKVWIAQLRSRYYIRVF
jgi:peptidyl-prolyl cis-trans isomerase SurA